jgi:hypothetical protein
MGKIATVLGENNINIGSAHAARIKKSKAAKTAYVNFFIERAREKDILTAVKQIKNLKIIKGVITAIRILGEY